MWEYTKAILRGDSWLRICLNERLKRVRLAGQVVDVGGGNQRYLKEMSYDRGATTIVNLDNFHGPDSKLRIDFEVDALPFTDGSVDQILFLNIMEHIYNYRHLVAETHRILRTDGEVFGFVPFLVQYHPDPHDYFRYTNEALERIFAEAGFRDISIEPLGGGSFLIQLNTLMRNVPRPVAVLLSPLYLGLDWLFLRLRPGARKRYPLGYFFTLRK